MYIKPGNCETYLESGKGMLARAWTGAKNFLGHVDYGLQQAQRIGNIAAPLVAEMGGHKGVQAKLDAMHIQAKRVQQAVGGAKAAHSRISDVAAQIY